MSTVFISHASRDDVKVGDLEAWLKVHGFTDYFVDHSESRGIGAGNKWRDALREQHSSCRVVLFLVTEAWLASDMCQAEFNAAWLVGKRLIPLFALADGAEPDLAAGLRKVLDWVRSEDQGIWIESCLTPAGGLNLTLDPGAEQQLKVGLRASGALTHVGLDPEAFAIDRKLVPEPFPGLLSFGDEDAHAAVFFGRSNDIAILLEWLREMRAKPSRRALGILGASGAGKSSLLRAGLIPRLRRETPAWLPLRAFRPGSDALLNFADALSRTMADYSKVAASGDIRDRLLAAWRKLPSLSSEGSEAAWREALGRELSALRNAAGLPAATILISIDQAEELVGGQADGGESADALSHYLRVSLDADIRCQLVFTVRSDRFSELQGNDRFRGIDVRGYDLRTLSAYRFDTVIERPAQLYGVEVEPGLVDEMMKDAQQEDALPLLAFALQRLWRHYAAMGRLTRANYTSVGRVPGMVQDAAERALLGLLPEQDEPLPIGEPPQRLSALGKSIFVPGLVEISVDGAAQRRPTDLSAFAPEQREFLASFIRWRLVVVREAVGGTPTVEVSHEALFKQWQRLAGWIEQEKHTLEALRSVQVAAAVWQRHERHRDWLDHRGQRLTTARRLRVNAHYRRFLNHSHLNYIRECSSQQRSRRLIWIASSVSILAFAVPLVAVILERVVAAELLIREADRLNERYEDSAGRLSEAGNAAARFSLGVMRLRLSDLHNAPCTADFAKADPECQLRRSGRLEPLVMAIRPKRYQPRIASFTPTGDIVFAVLGDGSAVRYRWPGGLEEPVFKMADARRVEIATFSPDRSRLAVLDDQGHVSILNTGSGDQIARLSTQVENADTMHYSAANFSGDLNRLFTADFTKNAKVWNIDSATAISLAPLHRLPIRYGVFAADGARLLTISDDNLAMVWDPVTGANLAILKGHDSAVQSAAFDVTGSLIATGSSDGTVRIWDGRTYQLLKVIETRHASVVKVAFTRSSGWVVAALSQLGRKDEEEVTPPLEIAAGDPDGDGGGNGNGGGGGSGGATWSAGSHLPPADTVRIWNVNDSREIATLRHRSFWGSSLEIDLDDRKILVTSDQGLFAWQLTEIGRFAGNELMHWACGSERRRRKPDIFTFKQSERFGEHQLRGRSGDICAWGELKSLKGWAQSFQRWQYILTGHDGSQ